jgi:hypothetical protein
MIVVPAGEIEEGDAVLALARDLLGVPIDSIERARGGRNARVFRVAAGGALFALKLFPSPPLDGRDRLATEVEALRLMQGAGLTTVARVVAADPARHGVLLSWLEGNPIAAPSDADVDAAAEFLATLHAMSTTAGARAFGRAAAEACLSGREVERQIRTRLASLIALDTHEPALAGFLHDAFAPALPASLARAERAFADAGLDFAAPLPQEKRSLVPADFGFHNCLRGADGGLKFLDFEYFGWDDPVKLVADMLQHPGTPLAPVQEARLRTAAQRIYGSDTDFAPRLAALFPLFGLRWVLILLNEFLPDRWQQRVAAGETESWSAAKARQLARARGQLARIARQPETAHG